MPQNRSTENGSSTGSERLFCQWALLDTLLTRGGTPCNALYEGRGSARKEYFFQALGILESRGFTSSSIQKVRGKFVIWLLWYLSQTPPYGYHCSYGHLIITAGLAIIGDRITESPIVFKKGLELKYFNQKHFGKKTISFFGKLVMNAREMVTFFQLNVCEVGGTASRSNLLPRTPPGMLSRR